MKKLILFAAILFSCNNGDNPKDEELKQCYAENTEISQLVEPSFFTSELQDSLVAAGRGTKDFVIAVGSIPACLRDNLAYVDTINKGSLHAWLKAELINNGWDTTKALVIPKQ